MCVDRGFAHLSQLAVDVEPSFLWSVDTQVRRLSDDEAVESDRRADAAVWLIFGLVRRRTSEVRRSLSRLDLGSRAPARPLHHVIRTHTVIVSRDGSRCHATCSRLTTRSRVHHPLLRLWSIPLIKPYPHPHHIDRTPHGPCAASHNPARPSQYPHTLPPQYPHTRMAHRTSWLPSNIPSRIHAASSTAKSRQSLHAVSSRRRR